MRYSSRAESSTFLSGIIITRNLGDNTKLTYKKYNFASIGGAYAPPAFLLNPALLLLLLSIFVKAFHMAVRLQPQIKNHQVHLLKTYAVLCRRIRQALVCHAIGIAS